MGRESGKSLAEILNQQTCNCGHDRLVHGQHLGKGKERVVILNSPHSGRCMVRGCNCSHFRYDATQNSKLGKQRREIEKKQFAPLPPQEDSPIPSEPTTDELART